MYSPKSVVDAMLSGVFDNYWNQTETYEALKAYIKLNFDGSEGCGDTHACGRRSPDKYWDIFQ